MITIISTDARGLKTNNGDFIRNPVNSRTSDIPCAETFLNWSVPENYGQICGYTKWHIFYRIPGTFASVAVSFHKSLYIPKTRSSP